MYDHFNVNGLEPPHRTPPLRHPRRSQSPKKYLRMQAPQLVISRPDADTILLQDDRFAHFLPALLAGPLFSAAKWLGGKAVSAVGSVLGGAAKKAASVATSVGSSALNAVKRLAAPAPEPELGFQSSAGFEPEEEYEEEGEYEEDGDDDEGDPYYENDQFDVHIGHDTIAYSSPHIAAMSDQEWERAASYIAGQIDDSMSELRDHEVDPEVFSLIFNDIDFEEPDDRFAHFSFKKAFKKIAKVAGPLLSKIGPVAALVPGLGTVAGMAASMAGKLLSSPKKPAASQVVEQVAAALPAAVEQVQAAAPQVQQAVSALPSPSMVASVMNQAVQNPSAYGFSFPQPQGQGWGPPMPYSSYNEGYDYPPPRRRRRRAPPPPPPDDYEEEEWDALSDEEYDFVTYDGDTELETGGRPAKMEVRRAHEVAKRAFLRAKQGTHRDAVTR